MRKSFMLGAAIMSLSAGSAAVAAEAGTTLKLPRAIPPAKLAPRAGASRSNPCSAYGPGFARVDGSDTCVKIGGAIGVGVGSGIGR